MLCINFIHGFEICHIAQQACRFDNIGRRVACALKYCSDIPENLQVFSGDEVLYFRSKDSNDLAEKIKFALEHPDAMVTLGKNCQKKVYSDYLWLNIACLYERLYNDLIDSK